MAKSKRLQLALDLLRQVEDEEEGEEPTLQDLWEKFRAGRQLEPYTWETYTYRWNAQWKDLIGHLRISELTPEIINQWRLKRAEQPTRTRSPLTTPGCRNNELKVLRSMLAWNVKAGNIGRDPLATVEYERNKNRRETVHTSSTIAAVERHANAEDWAMFSVAITGGLRKNEVRCLQWPDVDLDTGVTIVRGRNAKYQQVRFTVISQQAIDALKALPRKNEFWIFPSPRHPNKPIAPETVTWRWHRVRERAGIQGPEGAIWFHDSRRSWGTAMSQVLPLPDVLSMGGWQEASTLIKSYHRLSPARLLEIRRAMEVAVKNMRKPPKQAATEASAAPKIFTSY